MGATGAVFFFTSEGAALSELTIIHSIASIYAQYMNLSQFFRKMCLKHVVLVQANQADFVIELLKAS